MKNGTAATLGFVGVLVACELAERFRGGRGSRGTGDEEPIFFFELLEFPDRDSAIDHLKTYFSFTDDEIEEWEDENGSIDGVWAASIESNPRGNWWGHGWGLEAMDAVSEAWDSIAVDPRHADTVPLREAVVEAAEGKLVAHRYSGGRAIPGPYARGGSLGKQQDRAMLQAHRSRVQREQGGVLVKGSTPDGAVWGSVADPDAPSGYINWHAAGPDGGARFHDYVPLAVKKLVRERINQQRKRIRSRYSGGRRGRHWRRP